PGAAGLGGAGAPLPHGELDVRAAADPDELDVDTVCEVRLGVRSPGHELVARRGRAVAQHDAVGVAQVEGLVARQVGGELGGYDRTGLRLAHVDAHDAVAGLGAGRQPAGAHTAVGGDAKRLTVGGTPRLG